MSEAEPLRAQEREGVVEQGEVDTSSPRSGISGLLQVFRVSSALRERQHAAV